MNRVKGTFAATTENELDDLVAGLLKRTKGLFLFIVAPAGQRNRHIHLLSAASRALGQEEVVDSLRAASSAREAHDILERAISHPHTGPVDDAGESRCLFQAFVQKEDYFEDILEANRMILETIDLAVDGEVDSASRLDGNVVIAEGAVVEGSVLRGPLVVGERSRILRSYIGPFTSIYHDVTIQNAEIEHSIVLENSRIANLGHRMERSLVGKDVEIVKSATMPKAYRFMVGDASRIEVP